MQTIGKRPEISLYFHVPFCTRKCDYCHFYVLPDQEANKDVLLDAFLIELERWLPVLQAYCVSTIYFGGGTPSLFGPSRLETVLEWIKQNLSVSPSIEINLEANPENINLSLMRNYAQAGVNRVSVGIQSLDDSLLKLLGRIHSSHKALEAVHLVKEAGIANISVDLMYDLPQQSLAQWEHTLQETSRLPIAHLSLYNLTIEPHTLFFKNRQALTPLIPDEETSLKMYEHAIACLENVGLQQYEISAFAKPGYQSRHNIGYWTARPFLGFGPSAFSYWQDKRFRCASNLNRYYQALKAKASPFDFEEQLDPEARRRELFVIQLRLKTGVCLDAFRQTHGQLDQLTLSNAQALIQQGLLEQTANTIRLTRKGILFYDTVASELI